MPFRFLGMWGAGQLPAPHLPLPMVGTADLHLRPEFGEDLRFSAAVFRASASTFGSLV
jgi:hypothetical protein